MKVAIVGNGPSAKGKGAEIDACDFVVRIKAWWRHGAKDAGEKINAWAWYGDHAGLRECPVGMDGEVWFTQCSNQILAHDPDKQERHLTAFANYSLGRPASWLSNQEWDRLVARRDSHHPSTGMVAVAMALARFPGCELHLFGFDSTTRDRPDFYDARNADLNALDPHRQLSEKQMFRRIGDGTWLGEPTTATLVWHDMPRLD
ncbi:hypothetical protein LCGC14_0336190 [marine sediment metagenome]|uniref:Uncharacterized protein n=1 Tax=marine sediment metagenome TaxID=412755 RepID=A0A0F9TKK3_9ZZZZ